MKVTLFPCGPAANESELKAFAQLKIGLQSTQGDDEWILLTNLAFSVTHQLQSDEIDIVAIGPPGVRVIEIKHWTAQWVDAHVDVVAQDADRVTNKARKIGTTLRKIAFQLPYIDTPHRRKGGAGTAAYLAVAFDTFESRVVPDTKKQRQSRPFYAFGLLSYFEREYSATPSPLWRSANLSSSEGEKHPSDRTHTERLMRLQQAIQKCVARSIGAEDNLPILTTDISPDKAQTLRELHRLCD